MARSNNNNKLKAFVRFDGSGRIVPGSLIVQSIKPKDGNWKETPAKECCNGDLPSNCIQFVVNTTDSLNFEMFTQSYSQDYTATVTWGDGSTEELSSGEGTINFSHNYASISTYTVRICFSDITVINNIEFLGND